MVAYRSSQKANGVSGIMGLYFYARQTPTRTLACLHRLGLCASPTSIDTMVDSLRTDSLSLAEKVAQDPLVPFQSIHDNLQFRLDVAETTLSNRSQFLNTTMAFITPMFNTTMETMTCDPNSPAGQGLKGAIAWSDVVLQPEEHKRMRHLVVYQMVEILITFSGLEYFKKMKVQLAEKKMSVHPIALHKTPVYPLAAMPHDEASNRGNRKVVDEILFGQLKVPKTRVRRFRGIAYTISTRTTY